MKNKEFEFFTELKQLLEKYEVTISSNDDYIIFTYLNSTLKDLAFSCFVDVENIEDYLNRSNKPKSTCHICKEEKIFSDLHIINNIYKNKISICGYCLGLRE